MKLQDTSGPQDPLDQIQKLWGLRPTVQEQVQHTAHTQIDIPRRQAMLVMQLRFLSYLGIAFVFILAGLSGYMFDSGHKLVALAILSIDVLLILAGVAFYPSRKLLLKRMEAEIVDPYHDDTLRELFEGYLERVKSPEPEIKIVREGIPYRVYQQEEKKVSEEEESDTEIDGFDDLIEFAEKAILKGLARETVWCKPNQPRVKLSTGTVVTQSKWRQLCESLKDWGLVENDAKGSYVWVNGISDNPQKAIEYLKQAKQEILKNAGKLWQPEEPCP